MAKKVVFCTATVLFWFSLYTYVPIVSTYAADLSAAGLIIGLIAGAYGLTQMILRIPIGIFSDRVGRRKPFILGGIMISAAAGLIVCLWQSPLSLFFCRAAGGAAAAAWVPFTVLFASYYPEGETTRAIGLISVMNSIGVFAATLVCGFLASRLGNVSTFITASLAAAAALVLALLIKEPPAPKRTPLRLGSLFSVVTEPNVLLLSILAILGEYMLFASTYGFTPNIARDLGAGSMQIGIMTSLCTVAALASAFLCSRIRASHAAYYLAPSFAVYGLSCILIPLVSSITYLYFLSLINGLTSSICLTLLMSLVIRDVKSEKRASAMGFFQAIYSLGMMLGPVITGFLYGATASFIFAYAVIGGCGFVAALLSLYYLLKTKRMPKTC